MLADATKDARARAEQIAAQGGRIIANLHDAEHGLFQITPLHSTDDERRRRERHQFAATKPSPPW